MKLEEIKVECYNQALVELGMGYVLRRRANVISEKMKITKVLTVTIFAVPGFIVLAYEYGNLFVDSLAIIFSCLSIYLSFRSGQALVLGYEEKLYYYFESASHHSSLSREFELLAKNSSNDPKEIEIKFDQLTAVQKLRDQQDDKYNITFDEEKMAMRYGLRQFRRECSECKEIPSSMSPSNCAVCGNFKN